MTTLDPRPLINRLRSIQADMRAALRAHMQSQSVAVLSRAVRDEAGDTIFGIDAHAEDILLEHCQKWGESQHFILIAEGLDECGIQFGKPGTGSSPFRLIVDPIDGSRGLMYDKRSAWCLMGVAPDRGPRTNLSDIEVAVMTELPTTRQATSDVLWAWTGGGAHGERQDISKGTAQSLSLVPSSLDHLRHGFASVCNFFQGGKELTGRLEEAILKRALGGWNPAKAEVYTDQYISSGGQLAEVALGRDRFVLDVRPLVHEKLGIEQSLTCRPYDVCTWLVATEAGCIVCNPLGDPLDAPLDLTTSVAFACYANEALAAKLSPIVREEILRHLE